MDLTTGLARLLSDRARREEFRGDPDAVCRALGIDAADRAAFVSLDPAGLDAQAVTLLGKRLWEVSGLLRGTFRAVGPEVRGHFMKFAEESWPTGHRRHFEDALAFCGWLRAKGIAGVSRAEENWLRFVLRGKRFGLGFGRMTLAGKERPVMQLFTRGQDGLPRWRAFYLW